MKFKINDKVHVFETVTGNKFGEYGTVKLVDEEKGEYTIKLVDGLMVTATEENVESLV